MNQEIVQQVHLLKIIKIKININNNIRNLTLEIKKPNLFNIREVELNDLILFLWI